MVEAGDIAGFSNDNDVLPVGYVFSGIDILYAEGGSAIDIGATLAFDFQAFPYKFSYAASYEAGNVTSSTLSNSKVSDPSTDSS